MTRDSIRNAVLARAPRGTEEKNKKALELGIEAAKNYERKNVMAKEHTLLIVKPDAFKRGLTGYIIWRWKRPDSLWPICAWNA